MKWSKTGKKGDGLKELAQKAEAAGSVKVEHTYIALETHPIPNMQSLIPPIPPRTTCTMLLLGARSRCEWTMNRRDESTKIQQPRCGGRSIFIVLRDRLRVEW